MTNDSNKTTAAQTISGKKQYITAGKTVDVQTTPTSFFQVDVGRMVSTKKNTGVVVLRYEPEDPKAKFLRSDS